MAAGMPVDINALNGKIVKIVLDSRAMAVQIDGIARWWAIGPKDAAWLTANLGVAEADAAVLANAVTALITVRAAVTGAGLAAVFDAVAGIDGGM